VNGDILTSIDFRAMLDFHREHSGDMTVAVQQYDVWIPYGVITTSGVDAVRIVEKPTLRNFVNTGIYLIQPDACQTVPRDCPYDMQDLITSLISAPKRGVCFPIREYWLDISHIEQYQRAATDVAEGAV
jgi:NDP-sugar pyrophosphorylase family protein